MKIELPLSHGKNSSGVKFKGASSSFYELNEENTKSLILVFKISFSSLLISKLCRSR